MKKNVLVLYLLFCFLVNVKVFAAKYVDIMFVGNSRSGKTYLRDAIIHGGQSTVTSYVPTNKLNFIVDCNNPISVSGQVFIPRYWDTPYYISAKEQIMQYAIKMCQIVVITVDTTPLDEGEVSTIGRLEHYLIELAMIIREKYPEMRIVLAGTKKDINPIVSQKILTSFKLLTGGSLVSLTGQDYLITSSISDSQSVLQIRTFIENYLKCGDIDFDKLEDISANVSEDETCVLL